MSDPKPDDNLGFKGKSEMAPGYVYAPYVPSCKAPEDCARKLSTKWSVEAQQQQLLHGYGAEDIALDNAIVDALPEKPPLEIVLSIMSSDHAPPGWKCPTCHRDAKRILSCEGRTYCEHCERDEGTARQTKLKVLERKRVPLTIGETTLVGTARDMTIIEADGSVRPKPKPPYKGGNCFSISGVGRVRNLSMETAEEALEQWPELAEGVDVEILEGGYVLIVDERIPAAWKNHECRSHGYFYRGE